MSEQGGTAVAQMETTIRRSITVDVDREHAFKVFTEDFDTWWDPSHSIGSADLAEAVIEPKEGGRWFERGVDGSECDWGRVLAWEPPNRVVLAWQIGADWKFDPDLVTEVEVVFIAEGPTRTRVELEHRNLDRFGPAAEQIRAVFTSAGGWPGLLDRFARATTS